jgi:hypothetical protein
MRREYSGWQRGKNCRISAAVANGNACTAAAVSGSESWLDSSFTSQLSLVRNGTFPEKSCKRGSGMKPATLLD